jgi:hypothetical protein
VTVRDDDGRLVTGTADAAPGDRLKTRVARAEITSRVETVRPVEPPPDFTGSAEVDRKSETEVAL